MQQRYCLPETLCSDHGNDIWQLNIGVGGSDIPREAMKTTGHGRQPVAHLEERSDIQQGDGHSSEDVGGLG